MCCSRGASSKLRPSTTRASESPAHAWRWRPAHKPPASHTQVLYARCCTIADFKATRAPPPCSLSPRRSTRSRLLCCARLLGGACIACLVSSLALEFLTNQKRTVRFVRRVAADTILVEVFAAALLLASIVRPLASPAQEDRRTSRACSSYIAQRSSRALLLGLVLRTRPDCVRFATSIGAPSHTIQTCRSSSCSTALSLLVPFTLRCSFVLSSCALDVCPHASMAMQWRAWGQADGWCT